MERSSCLLFAMTKMKKKKMTPTKNDDYDDNDDDYTSSTTSPVVIIINDNSDTFYDQHKWKILLYVFLIVTCMKVLLYPSYRSTDFDVHRHWKSITRHLPIQEWYFDDTYVKTFHTLDYPPSFAILEYLLGNNPSIEYLLSCDPRN